MLSLYKIKHLLRKIHGKKLFLEFADEKVSQFDALFDDNPETLAKYRYQQKQQLAPKPTTSSNKPEYLKPIKNNSLAKRIMSSSKRQNASVNMTSMQHAFADKDTTFIETPMDDSSHYKVSTETYKQWVDSGFKTLMPEEFFALFMSGLHKNGKLTFILGTGSNAVKGDVSFNSNDIEVTSGKTTASKISFKYRPGHTKKEISKMKVRNVIENTFIIRPHMIEYALPLPKLARYAFYIRLKDSIRQGDSNIKDVYLVLTPKKAGLEYRNDRVQTAFDNIVYMVSDMMSYFKKTGIEPSEQFAKIFNSFRSKIIRCAYDYHNGFLLGISYRDFATFFNKYAEKLTVDKLTWPTAKALSGYFVKLAKMKRSNHKLSH